MSDNYFEKQGYISASLLKEISNHPKQAKAMLEGSSKQSTALSDGSLVDVLLTQPDKFDELYVIYRGKKPTDKLLDVAEMYISIYQSESVSGTFDKDRAIISSQQQVGYDGRLKPETMIKRFDEECYNYCNFVINNPNKIIIDEENYNKHNRLALNAKASPYLQHIFSPSSNLIVLFQVEVYVATTRFSGKALIDCIVIDLFNRTITPYDFKTFEGSFESNYWKFKYYYQEAWYSYLLETLRHPEFVVDSTIPEELKVIESEDFSLQPFKFIAIDKSEYKEIEIFQSYPEIVADVFFIGHINKGDYKVRIKSISQLIEELEYRVSIGDWSNDYEMLTKGVKKLWL